MLVSCVIAVDMNELAASIATLVACGNRIMEP